MALIQMREAASLRLQARVEQEMRPRELPQSAASTSAGAPPSLAYPASDRIPLPKILKRPDTRLQNRGRRSG
jgi:hypothetical protein